LFLSVYYDLAFTPELVNTSMYETDTSEDKWVVLLYLSHRSRREYRQSHTISSSAIYAHRQENTLKGNLVRYYALFILKIERFWIWWRVIWQTAL